jgi:hypothetical protein
MAVQSSSGSHLAAGCNRRAAAATEGAGLSCAASGQAVTSYRVIRRAPIRSGSTIQMASEVPACAHWVALMTYSVVWPRARALSTHGATPEKDGQREDRHPRRRQREEEDDGGGGGEQDRAERDANDHPGR